MGIDHGFSFPITYFHRYRLASWDAFLADFRTHWPTDGDHIAVDAVRSHNPRTGEPDELRLSERWTTTAKSVFWFEGPGTVAKSTHAGLPWLDRIRRDPLLEGRVHFWPFDGFEVPAGVSIIVEVYPAIFRRRYPDVGRDVHQQDAYATSRWLQEVHNRGFLNRYLKPPLTASEGRLARYEGWILGVA